MPAAAQEPDGAWLIFHGIDHEVVSALASTFSTHPAILRQEAVASSSDLGRLASLLGLDGSTGTMSEQALLRPDDVLAAALKTRPRLRLVVVHDGLVGDPMLSGLKANAPSDQVVFLRISDVRAYPEYIIDGVRAFAWLPEDAGWRETALTSLKVPGDGRTARSRVGMSRPKIALTWWGTWPYSQVTLGDAMSVASLAAGLRRRGLGFHIVHRERQWTPTYRIPGFRDEEVWFEDIDPRDYSVCVFVCGPLPTDWPEGRTRLLAFANAMRLAVGTTLSKPSSRLAAEEVFHKFLARDGFEKRWMDLSLSCEWPIVAAPREPRTVALCFRGAEPYYGNGDASAPVEALVEHAIRSHGFDILRVSTIPTDSAMDWGALDTQFGRPAALVTTRLHGCLLSLRHGTPFIAIDQIIGGKKVRAINEQLEWPFSFAAEDLSLRRLDEALHKLLLPETLSRLDDRRQAAVQLSEATLSTAIDWIEEAFAKQH